MSNINIYVSVMYSMKTKLANNLEEWKILQREKKEEKLRIEITKFHNFRRMRN